MYSWKCIVRSVPVLSTVGIKQSSNYGYSVLIMVDKRLSTQQLVKSSVVGVSLNYVHSPLPHQSTRVTHHQMLQPRCYVRWNNEYLVLNVCWNLIFFSGYNSPLFMTDEEFSNQQQFFRIPLDPVHKNLRHLSSICDFYQTTTILSYKYCTR